MSIAIPGYHSGVTTTEPTDLLSDAAETEERFGKRATAASHSRGTVTHMDAPRVLSMNEFRIGVARFIRAISDHGGRVFVGAHRKPQVVVISVDEYEALVAAASRPAPQPS